MSAPAQPVKNSSEARRHADLLALANSDQSARWLVERFGRRWRGLGKAFRCVLPGHTERHASAAVWRGEDGELHYHDTWAQAHKGPHAFAAPTGRGLPILTGSSREPATRPSVCSREFAQGFGGRLRPLPDRPAACVPAKLPKRLGGSRWAEA